MDCRAIFVLSISVSMICMCAAFISSPVERTFGFQSSSCANFKRLGPWSDSRLLFHSPLLQNRKSEPCILVYASTTAPNVGNEVRPIAARRVVQVASPMRSVALTPTKSTKAEKDVESKRPLTSFFLFFADKRAAINAKNPGLNTTEVAKKVGDMWRSCTPKERQPFETRAAAARTEYNAGLELRKKLHAEEAAARKAEAKAEKEARVAERAARATAKAEEDAIRDMRPKRPLTSFMLFLKETRQTVLDANPGISWMDAQKKVGEMWRVLSPIRRKPFEEAAAIARAEFVATYGEEALVMHPRAASSRVRPPITTVTAEDTLRGLSKTEMNRLLYKLWTETSPTECKDLEARAEAAFATLKVMGGDALWTTASAGAMATPEKS